VPRQAPDLRREQILDAVVVQIVERGLNAIRAADVAKSLGISPGLIFYYFPSKERWLAEAFAYAAQRDLEELDRILARPSSAVDRLQAALALYAPTGKAHGWQLWIDGWAAALREPEMRRVFRQLDLAWQQRLTAVIASGISTGEMSSAEPADSARRIAAFLDGLAVQVIVREDSLSRETLRTWVRDFVAHELSLPATAA
jgi:AcrR family transcriptional regulator